MYKGMVLFFIVINFAFCGAAFAGEASCSSNINISASLNIYSRGYMIIDNELTNTCSVTLKGAGDYDNKVMYAYNNSDGICTELAKMFNEQSTNTLHACNLENDAQAQPRYRILSITQKK
ncbi:hypothetical protein [Rahnella laticis]|uniref:hypothetical protein n=1 Tax=Rahnella laticis TaxID=2787622 RepID=UPI0018A2E079|nr:hypothetical protein [Rahnella laticis]MBF7997514.1 hypothetical protein [Rahnella laticis]